MIDFSAAFSMGPERISASQGRGRGPRASTRELRGYEEKPVRAGSYSGP